MLHIWKLCLYEKKLFLMGIYDFFGAKDCKNWWLNMCEQTSILYAFTLKNPIPMIIALSALSQIKLFICSNMFTFVCRNLITMQNVVYSARLVMVRAGNLLIVECNSRIYIPLVLLEASKIFCGFWWSFRRGFYT